MTSRRSRSSTSARPAATSTPDDPRGWRLGGGVTYAALTTARLGLRTAAYIGVDDAGAPARTSSTFCRMPASTCCSVAPARGARSSTTGDARRPRPGLSRGRRAAGRRRAVPAIVARGARAGRSSRSPARSATRWARPIPDGRARRGRLAGVPARPGRRPGRSGAAPRAVGRRRPGRPGRRQPSRRRPPGRALATLADLPPAGRATCWSRRAAGRPARHRRTAMARPRPFATCRPRPTARSTRPAPATRSSRRCWRRSSAGDRRADPRAPVGPTCGSRRRPARSRSKARAWPASRTGRPCSSGGRANGSAARSSRARRHRSGRRLDPD